MPILLHDKEIFMTHEQIFFEIDKTKTAVQQFAEDYRTETITGAYENWNARDTLAHIYDWLAFSKNKLCAIAAGEPFCEVTDIDAFNRERYRLSKNRGTAEPLARAIGRELDAYKEAAARYAPVDLCRKDFSTGFGYELWRYLLLDTVIHPILHFTYYRLKTRRFAECAALLESRIPAFTTYSAGDNRVYSLSEYIEDAPAFRETLQDFQSAYSVGSLLREPSAN